MGLGFVVPWVLDGARGSGAGTPQLLGGQGANYAHQITISPIRILDLPPVLNHAGRAISELTFFFYTLYGNIILKLPNLLLCM